MIEYNIMEYNIIEVPTSTQAPGVAARKISTSRKIFRD